MKKTILILSAAFFLSSCFQQKGNTAANSIPGTQVDTLEGSCPYITKDSRGNIVLSWIRKTDSSELGYCYAVSTDNGKSFGKPIEIPGTGRVHPHGENMPKIIFKPDGAIIAVWATGNPNPHNAYADEVWYCQSFDQGQSWTSPQKLVKDTAGYDQRYFDMALLPSGEVAISWLDNRKKTTAEGSALYFAETSGNSGFKNERLVSEPCCPCCRTDLFVDSKNDIHILYRAILNDSIRDMVQCRSTDLGKTFTAPERISKDNWVIYGCPHTGPAMTENKEGLQYTWFTGGADGGIYYCHSASNREDFSAREKVRGTASRHCQITSTDNNQIAITWNENFINGASSDSRIGLEIRNADGSNPEQQFITPVTGNATFPVISATGPQSVLVAYTYNQEGKDHICYRIIKWDKG